MFKKSGSPSSIKKVDPIRKQIYQHLRQQILDQVILPTSRLVESQIATEYGVSRTPVREALHLLEKDGFIEAIARVGYRVKELAWDELEEVFELRRVNEALACQWAIRRIDKKTIKSLEKNIAQSRDALEKNDPDRFLKYDEAFHETIGKASQARHLYELCQHLRRLMLRYRTESIKTTQTIGLALHGHEQMLECLKKGDEEGLVKMLTAHLKWSKEDIKRHLGNN